MTQQRTPASAVHRGRLFSGICLALAGLGTLSESRQLLFAALLLADQIVDGRVSEIPTGPDPELVERTDKLAERLESLADALEQSGHNA